MALTAPITILTGPIRLGQALHRADKPVWVFHAAISHTGHALRQFRRSARPHHAIPALGTATVLASATALVVLR